MEVRRRNAILFLLAATAGSVDAWSYFVLGHVFVANMTGNTVLLGVALVSGPRYEVFRTLLSLGCYGAGVFAGGLLARRVSPKQTWAPQLTGILGVESILLIGASLVWLHRSAAVPPEMRGVLIGVCAAALGLQSAAMQALKLPGVVTTYLTGTWTTMWTGLARCIAGGERNAKKRRELLLQASVLATYCASAAGAGWLARFDNTTTGLLPAVSVAAAVLLAALSPSSSRV